MSRAKTCHYEWKANGGQTVMRMARGAQPKGRIFGCLASWDRGEAWHCITFPQSPRGVKRVFNFSGAVFLS
jgi:hypothetical protein